MEWQGSPGQDRQIAVSLHLVRGPRNLPWSSVYLGRHSCPGVVRSICLCQWSAVHKPRSSNSAVPGSLARVLLWLRLSGASGMLLQPGRWHEDLPVLRVSEEKE